MCDNYCSYTFFMFQLAKRNSLQTRPLIKQIKFKLSTILHHGLFDFWKTKLSFPHNKVIATISYPESNSYSNQTIHAINQTLRRSNKSKTRETPYETDSQPAGTVSDARRIFSKQKDASVRCVCESLLNTSTASCTATPLCPHWPVTGMKWTTTASRVAVAIF